MPASIDRRVGGRKRLGMEGTVCQIVRQRRIGRIHDGRTTTATAEKATTHTAIESVVAALPWFTVAVVLNDDECYWYRATAN